jgi:hypothetical protein
MATIVLSKGIDLNHLPPPKVIHWINLDVLAERLNVLRQEWREVADLAGKPLEELQTSAGLMLDDFSRIIEGRP